MSSVLIFSGAPKAFPQTLRKMSNHRLPSSKNAILIHKSSFREHFMEKMKGFDQQKLFESARVRRSGSFNGVEGSVPEEDESDLRKTDLELEGFESSLNRMSKWGLAIIFSLTILWKRDTEVMWAAMGLVLNFWLSISLKQMLNQERPSALRCDPGMPSSHAQSLFYAIVFAVLSLINWMNINALTVAIGTFTLICGSYLSWLRVSQKLHTVKQVLVGAAIGSTCGITWFWIWHEFVLQTFISSIWVQKLLVIASIGCLELLKLNGLCWRAFKE